MTTYCYCKKTVETCKSKNLRISDVVMLNDEKLMTYGCYAIKSVVNLTKSELDGRERTSTLRIAAIKTHRE